MLMKLNKDYKYLILCEDKLTQCFVRHFLKSQGINGRKIFPFPLPAYGCGEQYVRSKFPKELKELRSKSYDSEILVVAIDADASDYNKRKQQLVEACKLASVESFTEKDKLLIFIPKRNIETWVKYFDGEDVDENTDYAHFLNGHESDCYSAAEKMSNEFSQENIKFNITSLNYAYTEYINLIKKSV